MSKKFNKRIINHKLKKTECFNEEEESNNKENTFEKNNITFLNNKRKLIDNNNFEKPNAISFKSSITASDTSKENTIGLEINKINNNNKNNIKNNIYYTTNSTKNLNSEDVYTEHDKDALAIKKKNMLISKLIKEGKLDPKIYRGQNAYALYLDKSERDIENSKVTGSMGPMRVNTTIKAISQVDYAKGICKDYKNTGVCGYGDGCVFMHDRSEYKSSYEIDLEIKKKENRKLAILKKKGLDIKSQEVLNNLDLYNESGDYIGENNIDLNNKFKRFKTESEKQKDKASYVCNICNNEFVNPVITICNHIFCESCALQNYNISKLCFVCKKELKGIFNNAEDVKEMIKIKSINEKRLKDKELMNKEINNLDFNINV